jgi:outer membrane beta-barrel protein
MTSTRQNRLALGRPAFKRLALKRLVFFVASSAAVVVTTLPQVAQAQRVSPLADAPAIRKREELRSSRFEGGLGFGSTVGQDFYHTLFLDLKLDMHINDWLSIGVVGGLGFKNLRTAFGDQLVGSLHDVPPVPREPTAATATASMEQIKSMAAAQLEFTPFAGKFSLAGKVFAHYDFYAFAGGAFLDVEPATPMSPAAAACSSTGTGTSCGVSGFKPGGTAGVGLHMFIKQWLALNVELRDIVARINPSGRDVNGDGFARTDDIGWGSTYIVTTNLSVYLPPAAVISQ